MSKLEVIYSSKSDEWSTPQKFFDEINKEFNFNLDPCCTEENHKCENFFTMADNGLEKNWGGTECFATLRIRRLVSGLKRLLGKLEMIIH